MPDQRVVIVAGSRYWGEPDIARAALVRSQGTREGREMLLRHGQCDPRDPIEGTMIPWFAARRRPAQEWLTLQSADWLADVLANRLHWNVKGYPADWSHGKRAGPDRNTRMIGEGGDEGLAFLSAGLPNEGTMDAAVKMHLAGIPLSFWCDACGSGRWWEAPCPKHSVQPVMNVWGDRAEAALW